MKVIRNSINTKTLKLGALSLLAFLLVPGTRLMADSTLATITVGVQSPRPVAAGGSASYTVTVTRVGNGNLLPVLSATGLPAGATASFSPNPLPFSSNITNATATMVISTEDSLAPGTYNFNVAVSTGSARNTQTTVATLEVGTFSLSIASQPDGFVCVSAPAVPGRSYSIQATTNLLEPVWTTLCATNCGENALLMFIDQDTKVYPQRFYRMSMVQ